jgi:hypothetical protein
MQKIQSYLYPNRSIAIADTAAFITEFKKVYARTMKIYSGIDNTVQFEIMNTDQKRLDLTTYQDIKLNVMDAEYNSVLSYSLTTTDIKGIATVTIPLYDIIDLDLQTLKYTLTGSDAAGNDVLFYVDSSFNAVGTMELLNRALPITRPEKVYRDFTSEIDIKGVPIFHSSAIPSKFYEAIKTTSMSFVIQATGFTGSIWLEATTSDTINTEAWRSAGKPFGSWNRSLEDGLFYGTIPFAQNVTIGDYSWFRVSYQTNSIAGVGASFNVSQNLNGSYSVTVDQGGTNYSRGSLIKVPGSQLGGVDVTNDLIIEVSGIDQAGAISSYTVSSISRVTWIGTSVLGTDTFKVSGSNYSGTVDSITVI